MRVLTICTCIIVLFLAVQPNTVRGDIGQTHLMEIESFTAPGSATQLAWSQPQGLLFLKNASSAIRVIDTTTKTQVGMELANAKFTDMDLTPSGRYLYAADYAGENTGYGTPLAPHYVHRFDMTTRSWSALQAPRIAYSIEAVDDDRFLLLEHDQWVDMTLNQWGGSITELKRTSADYYGDIAYDAKNGRVIHGNSGSSSSEIMTWRLSGNNLVLQEQSGTYGTAQSGGGTCVLSTDCENFYFGRLQVEAMDITNNRIMFPEMIYAASSNLAFGKTGYYDSLTGTKLGTLGFDCTAYALNPSGTELWAFNSNGDVLHHFAITPEPASLALLALAGVFISRRQRA